MTQSSIDVRRYSQAPDRAPALSPEEVKTRLREQGTTLKAWSQTHGFNYHTVSAVLRGVNRATFGTGHRIAVALGLK